MTLALVTTSVYTRTPYIGITFNLAHAEWLVDKVAANVFYNTASQHSHVHALGSRPFDSGCKLILVGNKYKVGCLSVCVCAVVCCLVLSCHSK